MPKATKRRSFNGGPLMTLFTLLLFLLPVLALGYWVKMTPEGQAAWRETVHQTAIEKRAAP